MTQLYSTKNPDIKLRKSSMKGITAAPAPPSGGGSGIVRKRSPRRRARLQWIASRLEICRQEYAFNSRSGISAVTAGKGRIGYGFSTCNRKFHGCFRDILLTYKHFATIPEENCSLLRNNDLHMRAERIPQNCISLRFHADQNGSQPIPTTFTYKNSMLLIMVSI